MDSIDIDILNILLKNSDTNYSDIAKQIYVSAGTVHIRMKKLIELGVVKGARLRVDYSSLGYDLRGFLGIVTDKSSALEKILADLEKVPEIIDLHTTTGNFTIFVSLICRNTNHLREVIQSKIYPIVGIQRIESFLSLSQPIDRPLHLPNPEDLE